MINIDFTNIDNGKLIGRLLPFWARGKKTSLLLQALISPLKSAHNLFKVWALSMYIDCHITAQKDSLEWYLKYRLKSHFADESGEFHVVHGLNEAVSCFSREYWSNNLHWSNELKWEIGSSGITPVNPQFSCFNTGLWLNEMVWNDCLLWENEYVNKEDDDMFLESVDVTTVYAPAIIDTVLYNHEDYERDIRNIMSKFMINFNPINIIVANIKD